MILKRVEKDSVVKAIYNSSNVLASKYEKTNGALTVTFKGGKNYTYEGVSVSDYTRFEIAESQGKILNTVIKKYKFVKNSDIDPSKILVEVDNIRTSELKEMEGALIKAMDKTITSYAKKEVMDLDLLKRVEWLVSKYQHELNG